MPLNRWERKELLSDFGRGGVIRIAARLKVRKERVSEVLNDHRRDPRIEGAIAKACALPVEQVFPPVPKPVPSRQSAA
jgi:hypothetical protein